MIEERESEQDGRKELDGGDMDLAGVTRRYLQSIIDTSSDSFLVLGRDLRVVTANRAFCETFHVSPKSTEGTLVYNLGNGQWNIPSLKTLLEDIIPNNTEFSNYEVVWTFPHIGCRYMYLDARKLYAPGNHTQHLLLSIRDETDARTMSEAMNKQYVDLQQAVENLENSLERERRITEALQRPLKMEIPEYAFPQMEVASIYSSAMEESEVGGDFYDAVPLADGRVAFVIGDASGKGLTAAARATEVKDVLRAFLRIYPYYPAFTLTRVNDYLCDVQSLDKRASDTFIALSLAVVNARRDEVIMSWAGIEPPYIIRANGKVEVAAGGGIPLGTTEREMYLETSATLRKGDVIVLTTDGLNEARRGADFLGREGLIQIIEQSLKEPTLKETGLRILDGARQFAGGKLQDDACLVLIRVA